MSRAEARDPLSVDPAAAQAGWSRSFGLLNPLRAVWWLFTSVRFAVVLLAILSVVSLIGVLLPQLPPAMRGDALAEAAWLDSKEATFGFLTSPMDSLGLFDIFHARWFAILLAVTAISTAAYIISRFVGVWTSITRPRMRVPDAFFETTVIGVQASGQLDPAAFDTFLRRQRYSVTRFEEPGAVYLFADRFQWAQLASFVTHAAFLLFIFAAVVSRVDAFSSPLFLAEGSTLPVFPVRDANQMQVELVDQHAAFATDGQPIDYSSEIVLYERGEPVKSCVSTVNSPCSHNGYRFYQSAYFGFGAAVQVRDLNSGNILYRETLALSDTTPSPQVEIRDAEGRVLLSESLLLTDTLSDEGFTYSGTLLELADGRLLTAGLRAAADGSEQQLIVLEPGGEGAVRLSLSAGERAESGGLSVTYKAEGTAASAIVPDLPLPPSADSGASGDALLQMTNVVYGTATASEGTRGQDAVPAEAPPLLSIVGLTPQAVSLEPGETAIIDDYEYTFLGQREFAGIHVRRNRSDYLVWIAAALLVAGIIGTFWVPRRRLWAKITATSVLLAGQAPSHANYERELRHLVGRAGSNLVEETGDDD